MIKQIHTILAVTLICSFLFTSLVHAQDDKPLWWHNLDCNDAEQHFSGIEYCKGKDSYTNVYHVIVIQLDSPGIQIEYLLPDGNDRNGNLVECRSVNRSAKTPIGPGCDDPNNGDWYPVMSLEQTVDKAKRQSNLAVVINGDYSACTDGPNSHCPLTKNGELYHREHGPEGLIVVQGNRLDGSKNGDGDNNIVARPYLVISNTSPLVAELHKSNSDNGLKPYNWIYTGVGGGPWLIQNGEVSSHAIATCENTPGSCYDGASQTAVGLTVDKKWMFFVVAVKADTLEHIAVFMKDQLGVWQAIKFDGGGSSKLYYEGANNPYIEPGDPRPLTNFLAIYAQPGKGIFPDGPSEPSKPPDSPEPSPSDDDLNWWQKIQKSWSDFWDGAGNWWQDRVDWWNGMKDDVANWWEGVKTWWKELPQRIEEWLLEQFMDWLTQQLNHLCGLVGMIPMAIAVIAYARRRHRS